MALLGSWVWRSRRASLPFLSVMVAPMRSPVALRVSCSVSTSMRTWSLTIWASSMAWRSPSVVVLAVILNVIFGVGVSSSWGSRVGMLKVRVYLPVIVMFSLGVSGVSVISMVSSLLVLRRSFRSSVMFMQSFWGWSHWYSSNMVLGHWKSIMATRLGSMVRSCMFSGVRLKVASSVRMAMDWNMFWRSLLSEVLSLNKTGKSPF